MTNVPPLPFIVIFAQIIRNICGKIATKADSVYLRGPLFPLMDAAHTRLRLMVNRLTALVARWRAGTLPKPRPSRAGQPRKPRDPPKVKLPNGQMWLVKLVQETAQIRGQLEHLLTNEELQEFLKAVPQAGRILRPLCKMLGADPTLTPAILRPSIPKPRKPRPARERKPRPVHPNHGWPRYKKPTFVFP
jgi:hypothetical protein